MQKNISYQDWIKEWIFKNEQNISTEQDFRGEKDIQKTIKTVYFEKQSNIVKQDHHEDIDKTIIQSLKKLDTSDNNSSLNYIDDKFKDIIPEGMSQENSIKTPRTHLLYCADVSKWQAT